MRGFFERLFTELDPRACSHFLARLEALLGSYRVPLQMTCKALFNRRSPIRCALHYVPALFVRNGDLELVKLFHAWQWNFGDRSELTTFHVPMIQFLQTKGLADVEIIFLRACDEFRVEAMDYLLDTEVIDRKCAQQAYQYCDNADALEHLYTVRKLPVGRNLWDFRVAYDVYTDVFAWALRHPCDPDLSVKYFFDHQEELLALLEVWCLEKDSDIHIMRYVVNDLIRGKLPRRICKKLPKIVAASKHSRNCQCNNPEKHELLRRPTKRLKFLE